MCGICAIISKHGDPYRNENLPNLLIRRGPDGFGECTINIGSYSVTIFASVLCCRSTHCPQPISDQFTDNILAWNGEIFGGLEMADKGNDGLALAEVLAKTTSIEGVIDTLKKVEGPYSFIYWHKALKCLFFGRDALGRRSLLVSSSQGDSDLVISSVLPRCSCLTTNEELLPTGIACLQLADGKAFGEVTFFDYQWPGINCPGQLPKLMNQLFPNSIVFKPIANPLVSSEQLGMLPSAEDDEKLRRIATTVQNEVVDDLTMTRLYEQSISEFVGLESLLEEFILELRKSAERRCKAAPNNCLKCAAEKALSCSHCKVGVLFSGGLDSTVLAALVDEFLPESETGVDLINVAFYQNQNKTGPTPPDRQTALAVVQLLTQENEARKLELVCVDVSQEELQVARRDRIRELILPCDTILDDSLGCALWFATNSKCPAKILIHGLGADELFAGYSRHRASFQNGGWPAVEACLLSDLANLPHRNLGRDDRVASDNSRELRHPFLDENVIRFVTSRVPVYLRINPYLPRAVGDKIFLRFASMKLAFQMPKWHDSLLKAAGFPKRAIQFGSRIANIEKESVRSSGAVTGRRINASGVSKKLLDD